MCGVMAGRRISWADQLQSPGRHDDCALRDTSRTSRLTDRAYRSRYVRCGVHNQGGKRMPCRSRFQFSERAEPLVLDELDPAVCGYAWRHPSPVAALVMLHGLQSHAQWFAEAGDGLFERGLSVYALER